VHREALLHAAVANNARWCEAVCRSHGHPGHGLRPGQVTGISNVFSMALPAGSLWASAR
jgi:hypothetical protein